MAIIVLNGANFSERNIGKIKVDNSFATETIQILTRYGVTVDINDPFQQAFDAFIGTLVDNGIYSKLKSMCLPFLASIAQNGNLSYATINALTGENFFTTDVAGHLVYQNKGLVAVSNATPVFINLTSFVDSVSDTYHLSAYNIESEPVETYSGEQKKYKCPIGSNTHITGLFKQAYLDSAYTNIFPCAWIGGSPGIIEGNPDFIESPTLLIVNIHSDSVSLVCGGSVVTSQKSNFTFGDSITNPQVFQFGTQNYNAGANAMRYACASPCSMLTLGDDLTDGQSQIFSSATDILMQAVKDLL